MSPTVASPGHAGVPLRYRRAPQTATDARRAVFETTGHSRSAVTGIAFSSLAAHFAPLFRRPRRRVARRLAGPDAPGEVTAPGRNRNDDDLIDQGRRQIDRPRRQEGELTGELHVVGLFTSAARAVGDEDLSQPASRLSDHSG